MSVLLMAISLEVCLRKRFPRVRVFSFSSSFFEGSSSSAIGRDEKHHGGGRGGLRAQWDVEGESSRRCLPGSELCLCLNFGSR